MSEKKNISLAKKIIFRFRLNRMPLWITWEFEILHKFRPINESWMTKQKIQFHIRSIHLFTVSFTIFYIYSTFVFVYFYQKKNLKESISKFKSIESVLTSWVERELFSEMKITRVETMCKKRRTRSLHVLRTTSLLSYTKVQ